MIDSNFLLPELVVRQFVVIRYVEFGVPHGSIFFGATLPGEDTTFLTASDAPHVSTATFL